jgi:hypothetical protein
LSATRSADRDPTGSLSLRFQWHPGLREEWAKERLYFWWLGGFPSYNRAEIEDKLRWVLAYNNVSAYAIYELYSGGSSDIMLRAWLSTIRAPLTRSLEQTFGSSVIIETMTVEEIVANWLWSDRPGEQLRQPDASRLREPLGSAEIAKINKQQLTAQEAAKYEKDNIVAPAPYQQGIKFAMLITANRQPRSQDAWANLRRQLVEILDSATSISERSLYFGHGFGRFLVMGRVAYEDYPQIATQLSEPINAHVAPSSFGARTATYIVATEDFLDFKDEMRLQDEGPPERPVEELLEDEESHLLEVKGSAFIDLNRWLHTGDELTYSDLIVNEGVLKTITGMLNSDGGTLVVGALETERYADHEALAAFPRCGRFICCGVENDYLGGNWDQFELRLGQIIRSRIRDNPGEWVRINPDGVRMSSDGGTLPMCVITVTSPTRRVEQRNRWFYHYPEGDSGPARFWVRQGNRTIELRGPDIDDHKDDKSR